MHLSRTPSPKWPFEEDFSAANARLVPLTTKYFTPKSRAELPGWRDSLGQSHSPLSINSQRPYVVSSKGQWTSQPKYPHFKHSRNVSLPTMPRTSGKHTLLRIPLTPGQGEIPLIDEQTSAPEEGKLYLPPLRLVDNRSSHHDHPGSALSELRLTAEADVYSMLNLKPKPKPQKPVVSTVHRPTPRAVVSETVRFRPPAPVPTVLESERPPHQEARVFTRFRKPLDIPERLIRRAKAVQRTAEVGVEQSEQSMEFVVVEETGESLFRYSEDSVDIDNRGRASEALTTAGPTPKRASLVSETVRHERKATVKHSTHTPDLQTVADFPSPSGSPALIADRFSPNVLSDRPLSSMTDNPPASQLDPASHCTPDFQYSEDEELEVTQKREETESSPDERGDEASLEDQDEVVGEPLVTKRNDSIAGMSTTTTLQDNKPTDTGTKVAIEEVPRDPDKSVLDSADKDIVDSQGTDRRPVTSEIRPATGQQVSTDERKMSKHSATTDERPVSTGTAVDDSRPLFPPVVVPEAIETVADSPRSESDPQVPEVPRAYTPINEVIAEEQSSSSEDSPVPTPHSVVASRRSSLAKQNSNSSTQRKASLRGRQEAAPRRSISDVPKEKLQVAKPSVKNEVLDKKPPQNPRKPSSRGKKPGENAPKRTVQRPTRVLPPAVETAPGPVIGAPYSDVPSIEITPDNSQPASPAKVPAPQKSLLLPVSRRASVSISSRRSSAIAFPSSRTDAPAPRGKPPEIFTFREVEYADPDEVFVKQFSFALMRVILGLDSPEAGLREDLAAEREQLEAVRKKVLGVDYKPVAAAKKAPGLPHFKSDGDTQLLTPTSAKAAVFRPRLSSSSSITTSARLKPRASISLKAPLRIQQKDEESGSSESESVSSDDPEPPHARVIRVSQSLTEFELKHLSMLKNIASTLTAKEEKKSPEPPQLPPTPESSSDDSMQQAVAPVTDVWFTGHAEDLADDVHQSLLDLFRDFRDTQVNAFTANVTNFFKDPHTAKTIDVMEATEKEEMDAENYRESVERRKFMEYMRALPNYQALHGGEDGELRQTSHERPHPREVRDLFRLAFFKRKLRSSITTARNGTTPAVLRAKPSYTFSGLDLKYYQQKLHKPHLSEPYIGDVVLTGGAHLVKDEALYRERVYIRMKQERNLNQFALKPKTRRTAASSAV